MSDDLVQRLRACSDGDFVETHEDRQKAADRIETLEAELAAERALADQLRDALRAVDPYVIRMVRAEETPKNSPKLRALLAVDAALAAHRAARTPQEKP